MIVVNIDGIEEEADQQAAIMGIIAVHAGKGGKEEQDPLLFERKIPIFFRIIQLSVQ